MNNTPTEWTLDGFVEHFDFVHHKMLDQKFVWVLGAGASYASGVPLGAELVDRWLKTIHVREDGSKTPIEKWATAERLGIPEFKYADRACFYPKIYERCFREYPEEGYAFLESVMSGKDPSPGYSILGAALAADPPRHNVVITTNFDNLVADALSIYTDTFPFVCGHESLTTFVRVAMRRPLICKIHRDLLLGPQNDPRSLRRMHDAWGTALRALLLHYTPVFIGYGGNDDTLMDLLESLQPEDIKGQLIWCYYEGGKPSERILNVVTDLNGVLVPVPDFDLLMVLLGEKMGIALMDEEIESRAVKRAERYRDRIQKLDTVKYPSVTKALAATFERSGGWWAWEQKARLEKDAARQEAVYRQGLQHYPKSAELHGNFAIFQWEVCKNAAEADRLYRKAVDLDPKSVNHLANYVEFLLATSQLPDASKTLKLAQSLNKGRKNEFTIVLLLFRALLALLKKEDATTAIHEIESLLSEGVSFEEWGFNTVLRCTKNKVSRKAAAVLAALARRINNPQQGHRPHVMKEQTTRPTLESKGQKKSVPLPRKPPLSARENQPALNRPSDGAEGRSITAGN